MGDPLTTLALVAGIGIALVLFFLLSVYGLPEKAIGPYRRTKPIMPGAEPFHYKGKSDTIYILSHGFGGSPFNLRPLAKHLHECGHTVICPLLPGHGTDVQDMTRTRYRHWLQYMYQVCLKESENYSHVFWIGLSMGGTLFLDLAGRNDARLRTDGIITISSPVFLNGFHDGRFIFHAPLMSFSGLMRIFLSRVRKRKRLPEVDRFNPWIGYRYEYALRALHSFKLNMIGVRAKLGRIREPYCNIMSFGDRTVPRANQTYIMKRIGSAEKRSLMFALPPDESSMHALLTHERAYPRVFRFIDCFTEEIRTKASN